MKRTGPMLWLILAVAAGLSILPLMLIVDEVTGHPVPEINPLFVGGLALFWLLADWGLVAICIAIHRQYVRIPVLVLLLMPYLGWVQQLGEQGFFWSIIRPDMATGEGYFDTKTERDLAAAIVACDSHDEPPKCDFPRIDALARAADGVTALMQSVQSMQFKSVALLLRHSAREDRVAQDGTTLEKLMAEVPPEMLRDLPPDVDVFVKRYQPR